MAVVESRSSRKERGGIYTPDAVAAFMTGWAVRLPSDRVLEPACGDGVFLAAATQRLSSLGADDMRGQVAGVEREREEAAKARLAAPLADVRATSFFDLDPSEVAPVDAVIGNPPYIRYHGFTGATRSKALARAEAEGVSLSNLASSWAHFLIHASSFVAPGGRLALVLPAELLHTDYAAPVRAWLLRRFRSVTVITFDRAAFDNAQVDALILLASDDSDDGLRVLRVADAEALTSFDPARTSPSAGRVVRTRWSSSIDERTHLLYERVSQESGAVRLGALAAVDIGVVTGANRFFVLDPAEARRRRLPVGSLLPIIQSAAEVPGLVATPSSTNRLLWLPTESRAKSVIRYLEEGKRLGIAEGYKCRTRKPWYRVPLPRHKPDAFLPYMNHHMPRLVLNRARAWSTNLLHGVFLKAEGPDVRALSAGMLSALTLLSAELEGRAYGGGVLKTETKEAERLLVPPMGEREAAQLITAFPELHRLVRDGKWRDASVMVDGILGIEHGPLADAAETFRRRRLDRTRKAPEAKSPALTRSF